MHDSILDDRQMRCTGYRISNGNIGAFTARHDCLGKRKIIAGRQLWVETER